jgi:hypothetical protein
MQVLLDDLSFFLKGEDKDGPIINIYDFQTEKVLEFIVIQEIANQYRSMDGSFTKQQFVELCSDHLKGLSEEWFDGNLPFDENGDLRDEDGNLLDDNGNMIDENGNIINE